MNIFTEQREIFEAQAAEWKATHDQKDFRDWLAGEGPMPTREHIGSLVKMYEGGHAQQLRLIVQLLRLLENLVDRYDIPSDDPLFGSDIFTSDTIQ